MQCNVVSCHVMSCHVMSCHVMSCHVMYVCMYWVGNGVENKSTIIDTNILSNHHPNLSCKTVQSLLDFRWSFPPPSTKKRSGIAKIWKGRLRSKTYGNWSAVNLWIFDLKLINRCRNICHGISVNASSAHIESGSSAHIESGSSAHIERSSAHIDAGRVGVGWGGVGWGGVQ